VFSPGGHPGAVPGEWRQVRLGPAAAALGGPGRDGRGVGAGQAAQGGGLAAERLVEFAGQGAFQDPGHFGQQVGPAGRELAQLGGRSCLPRPSAAA
jgi:hypothetical protein